MIIKWIREFSGHGRQEKRIIIILGRRRRLQPTAASRGRRDVRRRRRAFGGPSVRFYLFLFSSIVLSPVIYFFGGRIRVARLLGVAVFLFLPPPHPFTPRSFYPVASRPRPRHVDTATRRVIITITPLPCHKHPTPYDTPSLIKYNVLSTRFCLSCITIISYTSVYSLKKKNYIF